MYTAETNCPFPIYTDPTRSLFDALGMSKTLALGTRPAYMRKSMGRSIVDSIYQGLKQLPAGNALKSGDHRQVGGEFLFEPRELDSPVLSPRDLARPRRGAFEEPDDPTGPPEKGRGDGGDEEKKVTWCHRMKTTRDHAEIPELVDVLGLDIGATIRSRKGVGLSMANDIRKMSAERSPSMTDLA